MRMIGNFLATLAMFLSLGCIHSAHAQDLKLQVGEVKVLSIPQVARVAVGDGHVMHAVATDEEEVIVFARNEGSSALQIWTRNGVRQQYQVRISPEGSRKAHEELLSVLERIPQTRVTPAGDKIIVEGDDLSDDDKARVAELAKRYPQLVDLTGQVGWDQMVLFDVQVVEIPRSQVQEFGFRWGAPPEVNASVGGAAYFTMNAMLAARLQAMERRGEAVVLAQPQLLARSGATAEFLAGGEVPYTTTDSDGEGRTVFKPYGVSLRITPQVERNGVVRSHLEVEVSAVDQSLSMSAGPSLKTRRTATEFNVRSGQTLVLAGFLSRESAKNRDGLPGLSGIPVLGNLFGYARRQLHETELAIFVTPRLVSADHSSLRDRIQNSERVLQESFSQLPRLNTPLSDGVHLPAALPASANSSWDPWAGSGSQWLSEESQLQERPYAGANEYALTE